MSIHLRQGYGATGEQELGDKRSLHGPVPFCHLRLFFSRNGKSSTVVSPLSSP